MKYSAKNRAVIRVTRIKVITTSGKHSVVAGYHNTHARTHEVKNMRINKLQTQ